MTGGNLVKEIHAAVHREVEVDVQLICTLPFSKKQKKKKPPYHLLSTHIHIAQGRWTFAWKGILVIGKTLLYGSKIAAILEINIWCNPFSVTPELKEATCSNPNSTDAA